MLVSLFSKAASTFTDLTNSFYSPSFLNILIPLPSGFSGTLILASLTIFLVIRPSLLKIYIIALAVEKFIFNSLAALLIVHPVELTLSTNACLYLLEILAYLSPCLPNAIFSDITFFLHLPVLFRKFFRTALSLTINLVFK